MGRVRGRHLERPECLGVRTPIQGSHKDAHAARSGSDLKTPPWNAIDSHQPRVRARLRYYQLQIV
jgi:hypothetical protein